MINIILLCYNRLPRKDIAYFSYFQDAFPKFTYVIQLSHLFIHRSQLVDQARNLRIIILQPFHLFTNELDTVQECYGWGIMMFCDAVLMGTTAAT